MRSKGILIYIFLVANNIKHFFKSYCSFVFPLRMFCSVAQAIFNWVIFLMFKFYFFIMFDTLILCQIYTQQRPFFPFCGLCFIHRMIFLTVLKLFSFRKSHFLTLALFPTWPEFYLKSLYLCLYIAAYVLCIFFKTQVIICSKIAKWTKALAAEPENLSLSPQAHIE